MEEEKGAVGTGQQTRGYDRVVLDVGVFRGIPGLTGWKRSNPERISHCRNRQQRGRMCGKRGTGWEKRDGWYGERHLIAGYFRVFRVLLAGISQSGKVVEIPRV